MSLPPLRSAALLASGAALAVLAALAGGDLAGGALRATAVVAILGLAAAAIRSRRQSPGGPLTVSVVERHAIAKETGVAVLAMDGRRLVVGYAPSGIALLAELGPAKERVP